MKILHTADWHMNDVLGRIDRSDDICRALERIAAYLEEYAVDVLLVAGDLMSERSRMEGLRTAVGDIRRIFGPFLKRGGTMVVIGGNHDNEAFFELLRDALDLVEAGVPGIPGTAALGRLYVAPRPGLLPLADAQGCVVQFVLMPYPTTRRYLRQENGETLTFHSPEEKHQAIQHAFTEELRSLESRLDPARPSVLVSHIHVRGVSAHSLFKIGEAEDVVFEPSDIPAHWAYVAYGHIHRAQLALPNATHIRYSGSVERMDRNESDDAKSVILCDVGASGMVGEPMVLPLDATPIYHVEIADPDAELPGLADHYPDRARALVSYRLHWRRDRHDRAALCRDIEETFPRWYQRETPEIDEGGLVVAEPGHADPITTVRGYLNTTLAQHAERPALLERAEALLAEEGWR